MTTSTWQKEIGHIKYKWKSEAQVHEEELEAWSGNGGDPIKEAEGEYFAVEK